MENMDVWFSHAASPGPVWQSDRWISALKDTAIMHVTGLDLTTSCISHDFILYIIKT